MTPRDANELRQSINHRVARLTNREFWQGVEYLGIPTSEAQMIRSVALFNAEIANAKAK